MSELRQELLKFAEENPRFVNEAIVEKTAGEDLSEYSTEEVIISYLEDKQVEELVKRFKNIMSYSSK